MILVFVVILTISTLGECGRLAVQGTHFVKDGQKVFLSGVNQAWINYAHDFGDHHYEYRRTELERYLKLIQDNGGNSIRIWVHIEGSVSPHFDSSGHVVGLDHGGTFLSDVKDYLHRAQQHNILVFFCLWNGASAGKEHYRLDGLIKDTGKLQSYIDKALIPWVKAVKDHPAMGGWDIINEMEGEIKADETNSEPCFNTKFMHSAAAGWAGERYTAQQLLRFINWQADAIRRTDPQALVTAGSWKPRSNVDHWGGRNLYKDSCLTRAGGKHMGTLTFYSTHNYAWQGNYDRFTPFNHTAAEFSLDKPLVVAEFSQEGGDGRRIVQLFNHLYTHGYSGGWTWHALATGHNSDTLDTQMEGLRSLKGENNQQQGGLVTLKL